MWETHLPTVRPHYAVKCNNDPVMLRWMRELNPQMGFDCASEREINEVLPIVGNPAGDIIYAQPCKKLTDIKVAQARGITLTVVDSVEEIEKLGDAQWRGGILVRLLVDDVGSKQPFGKKFGAPRPWLRPIFDAARAYKLHMTGFSFHVGSECGSPKQYQTAIELTHDASQIAKDYAYDTTCVDIGGGFLPDEDSFKQIADHVKYARKLCYRDDPAVAFIAEPGRFLAAPTHTLYTTVIGKKPVWPAPSAPGEPAWRITIDESVYGAFSNIPFDHQTPVFEHVRGGANAHCAPTVVFGRTCDSGDCVGTHVPLPDVAVGDVLRVANMGAYTTVTASEFNGFPKAQCIYETAT